MKDMSVTNFTEMIEGYRDGLDSNSPEPGDNRSGCYIHGFRNGRDDLNRKPRARAETIRAAAEQLIKNRSGD